MKTPGAFWWQQITGPRALVARVAGAMRDRRVPLLSLPPDVPYREEMRGAVKDAIEERFGAGGLSFVLLDAEDDCPSCGVAGIEDLLLETLADREVAGRYRANRGTVQEYLRASGSLRRKIVWVKGMPASQLKAWLRVVGGFGAPGDGDGLFLLESRRGFPVPPWGTSFEIVEFANLAGRENLSLFNSMLLDGREDSSPAWRDYMASAAAYLCEHDAELSEALLEEGDWRRSSPVDLLRELADDERFELRGQEEGSAHALALARRGGEAELSRRLWEAQVRELFPLVERLRLEIVERLGSELRSLLRRRPLVQSGIPVEDPEDLELCTLRNLANRRGEEGHVLRLPDEALRAKIQTLCECRNLLAHRKCCSPGQAAFILDAWRIPAERGSNCEGIEPRVGCSRNARLPREVRRNGTAGPPVGTRRPASRRIS